MLRRQKITKKKTPKVISPVPDYSMTAEILEGVYLCTFREALVNLTSNPNLSTRTTLHLQSTVWKHL